MSDSPVHLILLNVVSILKRRHIEIITELAKGIQNLIQSNISVVFILIFFSAFIAAKMQLKGLRLGSIISICTHKSQGQDIGALSYSIGSLPPDSTQLISLPPDCMLYCFNTFSWLVLISHSFSFT